VIRLAAVMLDDPLAATMELLDGTLTDDDLVSCRRSGRHAGDGRVAT
jgi:hypothetical protein